MRVFATPSHLISVSGRRPKRGLVGRVPQQIVRLPLAPAMRAIFQKLVHAGLPPDTARKGLYAELVEHGYGLEARR
jgi:hypothetical protein